MGDTSELLELVEQRIGDSQASMSGAEIGVHRGRTSRMLLERFRGLHLLMIDPWQVYDANHPYRISGDGCSKFSGVEQIANQDEALANTIEFHRRRTSYPCTSREAARLVLDASLDFVFIDGDHTRDAVWMDLNLWTRKVKQGGLICGHDFGHPRDKRGQFGVASAVIAFAARSGLTVQSSDSTLWWFHRADLSAVEVDEFP